MKAKPLILTHLAVGLLGIALAYSKARQTNGNGGASDPSKKVVAISNSNNSPASKSDNERKSVSEFSRHDFEAAWKALPGQSLSTRDRIETQKRLLREWAKVDLEAAMHAALAEAWDSEFLQWFNGKPGPLARAFAEAFAEDPEGSWLLIQSGKFGVGASLLRDAWYESMASTNPALLAKKLHEVPQNEIGGVLERFQQVARTIASQQARTDILNALLELPEHLVGTENLMPFLDLSRPQEEVRKELAGLSDFSTRKANLLMGQLSSQGQYQMVHNLASPDGEKMTSLREDVVALPGAAQGEFLYKILTNFGENTYWGGEQGGRGTLNLLDLMIEGEHWSQLSTSEASTRLEHQTTSLPAEDVAAWAANLPEREELTELFHRGVDNYIRDNMDLAWDWIQEFPQGRWRDRALAEYSQQALNAHDDYEASRRALDAIADEAFRQEAEGWRDEKFREMDGAE